jgi:methylase of polypeptide subunit release factors
MNRYISLTEDYLDRNKSLARIYTFNYGGKDFIGLNTVFSPLVFEDTYFFAEHIPCEIGTQFLEIGSGTGLISVMKALQGVNATATDINPDAITNIKLNVILHSLEHKVEVIFSDIFESIKSLSAFDTIFWNPPFIFSDACPESFLEMSVFDFKYSSIERFISSFSQYLKPSGHAYIGFSSTSGNIDYFHDLCFKQNLSLKMIAKSYLDGNVYEEPFSLELYELVPNQRF